MCIDTYRRVQKVEGYGHLLHEPARPSLAQAAVLDKKRVQVALVGILQDQRQVVNGQKDIVQSHNVWMDELQVIFHLALGVLVVFPTRDELDSD